MYLEDLEDKRAELVLPFEFLERKIAGLYDCLVFIRQR
ncbi:hypothetical protein LIMU106485_07245 [Limosilactobacillus mucosae]